ncbi:aminoglycoside phosphotransferase family protein [Streptomyces sp. sk2.1]|uniref:aminoglycoside phosphotransferase family protein n=1 Tax=Streptomyces sp. sk2.1 TaxID=2478959 RepID=UPI0011E65AB9|nr:aminoglycoside phosphotransferase family protein [Streptomyces sp. sk2.1]TXS77684.1 aminoglycoside phosphotransferase family protein [Streptomyces sp. sk2.1]
MTTAVIRALGDLAHRAAHPRPETPCACPSPTVLADRADGTVVRSGTVVAKAHAPGTDAPGLLTRLALADDPRFAGILLAPLHPRPARNPEAPGPDVPVRTALPDPGRRSAPQHHAHGPWLLIDVDDLGLGDPAWDLARPAAWYAAGLLPPEVWSRFLGAYRAAGGPAVRAEGDPWPELDVPARALTVQSAALAIAKSAAEGRAPDEVERTMLDACARIASLLPELAAGQSS